MTRILMLFPWRRRAIGMRRPVVSILVLASMNLLAAQSAATGGAGYRSTRSAQHALTRAAELEIAMAAAMEGNLAEAEALLARDVRHARNTLQADIQIAAKLVHIAFSLRQRGLNQASLTTALRALAKLNGIRPEQLAAATPQLRAQVWQMAGLIQERLLFGTTAARTFYLKAQQEHPEVPGARAGLERINRINREHLSVIPTKG